MDLYEPKIAKRCPECDGEPQFVHYCIPENAGGEFECDENEEYSPMILLKRLECIECGATAPHLVLSCDDAIEYWNKEVDGHRLVLRKYRTEKVQNIEPKSDVKILEKTISKKDSNT